MLFTYQQNILLKSAKYFTLAQQNIISKYFKADVKTHTLLS